MRTKYLFSLILLLVPISCYASETDFLEPLFEIGLILLYGSIAISYYCAFRFYKERRKLFKEISLFISIPLTIFGLMMLMTSYVPPLEIHNEGAHEFARTQLIISITILISNILNIGFALRYKSYSQLETILGRIAEDKELIIWASIKRKSTGKFEVSLHYKRDKWANFPKKFYSLPDVRGDEERRQYDSIQEAVDYLRAEFNLKFKFVERGKLQSEYKKLPSLERNSSANSHV